MAMYHVLLVDDDDYERDYIASSPIWQKDGFKLVASATNGEDASKILNKEKIDIVVTDIRMPIMDGLELSKLVRKEMPNVKIIILSGHSEFQYARQALSLGVSEYMVKPVKPPDLLETLRKVAAKIEEETRVYQEVMNYREQLQMNQHYQYKALLENLSLGIISLEQLNKEAAQLGFSLDFPAVCCAIITYLPDNLHISDHDRVKILESQQIVEEMLKGTGVIYFVQNLREIFLIFRNPDISEVKAILRQIHDCIKPALGLHIIALGGIRHDVAGIAESFADARFLINFQHLVGSQELLFLDEVLPAIQSTHSSELALANELELIANTLKLGGKNDVPEVVAKLVRRLQSMNLSLMFLQYTYIEITKIVTQFLAGIDEDPLTALVDPDGSPNALLSGSLSMSGDIPAFGQYLVSTLYQVLDLRDKKKRYKYNNVILKAKKHIDQNFTDPSINLGSVASFVNVNASYFSTLFNQEMGESFIEYLTGLRIEKAKVLIRTTSMRTTDIAFAVGYTDSNYFSKIFRKMTDESPRSFKNKA
jgi:two-component system, response regulator YesN